MYHPSSDKKLLDLVWCRWGVALGSCLVTPSPCCSRHTCTSYNDPNRHNLLATKAEMTRVNLAGRPSHCVHSWQLPKFRVRHLDETAGANLHCRCPCCAYSAAQHDLVFWGCQSSPFQSGCRGSTWKASPILREVAARVACPVGDARSSIPQSSRSFQPRRHIYTAHVVR